MSFDENKDSEDAKSCAIFFLNLALDHIKSGNDISQVRRCVKNAYAFLQGLECPSSGDEALKMYTTDNFEAD